MTGRAPVLRGFFAVDKALFKHAHKEHLFPAVVFGTAGGDFAGPVIGIAQAFLLGAHIANVGVGPLGGVGIVFYGRVFSGQAKGVPAHGMQHVEALHAFAASHHVANGIVAHVPHVDVARRVGEHLQHIVLGLAAFMAAGKRIVSLPAGLPFFFYSFGIIAFLCHGAYRFRWRDWRTGRAFAVRLHQGPWPRRRECR